MSVPPPDLYPSPPPSPLLPETSAATPSWQETTSTVQRAKRAMDEASESSCEPEDKRKKTNTLSHPFAEEPGTAHAVDEVSQAVLLPVTPASDDEEKPIETLPDLLQGDESKIFDWLHHIQNEDKKPLTLSRNDREKLRAVVQRFPIQELIAQTPCEPHEGEPSFTSNEESERVARLNARLVSEILKIYSLSNPQANEIKEITQLILRGDSLLNPYPKAREYFLSRWKDLFFALSFDLLTNPQLLALESMFVMFAADKLCLFDTDVDSYSDLDCLNKKNDRDLYKILKVFTQDIESWPCQVLAQRLLHALNKISVSQERIGPKIAIFFSLAGRYADLFPNGAEAALMQPFRVCVRAVCGNVENCDSLDFNTLASLLLEKFAEDPETIPPLIFGGVVLLAQHNVLTAFSHIDSNRVLNTLMLNCVREEDLESDSDEYYWDVEGDSHNEECYPVRPYFACNVEILYWLSRLAECGLLPKLTECAWFRHYQKFEIYKVDSLDPLARLAANGHAYLAEKILEGEAWDHLLVSLNVSKPENTKEILAFIDSFGMLIEKKQIPKSKALQWKRHCQRLIIELKNKLTSESAATIYHFVYHVFPEITQEDPVTFIWAEAAGMPLSAEEASIFASCCKQASHIMRHERIERPMGLSRVHNHHLARTVDRRP